MRDLEYYRAEIDKIDTKLIALMEERMDVAKHVGEIKLKTGAQILDEKREQSVLASRVEKVSEKEYEGIIEEFFKEVIELSKTVQKRLLDSRRIEDFSGRAAYQGVDGGYGSIAASKIFGENIYNVRTFENVFEEVLTGRADYGVVPLENSTTGSITDVVDMLSQYELYIVGETAVKAEHNLLGLKGAKIEDIDEVFSHEQGFSQCKEFLKDKNWICTGVVNTAVGAKTVAELQNPKKAAIASSRAAKLYSLEILKEKITTRAENATRFVILAKNPLVGEFCTKAAITFSVPHVSGSLVSALEIFKKNDVNIAKIESRPMPGRIGEYFFFAELEGNIYDANISEALKELRKYCPSYKYLGNFRKI